MKNSEIFLNNESIAFSFVQQFTYSFEVLPHIKEYILKLGSELDSDYELKGENIWIHKSAKVATSASINGPCIIDALAEIRQGAFIRGSAIIGKSCVIGNSCEIKNAIIFNCAEIPHFNYIGDSILGYHAHMGAGSITSNIKSDRKLINIYGDNEIIETNLRKVGAFLGDYVEIGCNSVLNPGTIIGPYSRVYPLVSVRGVIPEKSIVKSMSDIVKIKE